MKKQFTCTLIAALAIVPAIAAAESISGYGYGTINPTYNSTGVPILDSFYFRFTHADHHLRHIAVSPQSGGTIELAFHDQNWDDQYYYTVTHRRLSSSGLLQGSFSDSCVGNCTRTIFRPDGDYVFVIRGFQISYIAPDHEMDEIGIVENNGQLTVHFNDDNEDDTFLWTVDFVWVPADRFSTLGTVAGTVTSGGADHRTIPTGIAVIRAFKFNFSLGDHHLKEIGIMTPNGAIDVFYSDKNQDDDFTYNVRYGVLL